MSEKKTKYVSLSIPVDIAKDIDELIEELGYWPSRSAFAREACLEKIREERRRLRELREAKEDTIRGTNPGISPR
jgi:Arc/MetJ-type ribon-helix-helix transcriptional regulator